MSTPSHPQTVILGAGIIGLSTAYYLSTTTSPSSIHLIDPAPELFASASGFAGGLLSKDWHAPASASLAALSFEEHVKLAKKDGGEKWGFKGVVGGSFVEGEEEKERGEGEERPEDWLMRGRSRAEAAKALHRGRGVAPRWLRRAEGKGLRLLSGLEETAIVNPLQLCNHLLKVIIERGVKVHTSTTAISISPASASDSALNKNSNPSILLTQRANGTRTSFPFSRLVIASGVWTSQVYRTLFPSSDLQLPIAAVAGHSLVMRSPKWAKPEGMATSRKASDDIGAVFSTDPTGYHPEMFYREDGSIWLGGVNSSSLPLPKASQGKAAPISSEMDKLKTTAEYLYGLSFLDKEVEVVREALCFRPITPRGIPIIAEVPKERLGTGFGARSGEAGVYVAAGHGPWGISLCLGTGKVLSEMMEGKEVLSADIGELGLQEGSVEEWQAKAKL